MANVKELMMNEEFVKQLENTEDLEALGTLFKENGVTYTEFFNVAKEAGMEFETAEEDELGEDALDNINGGILGFDDALKFLSATELGKLGWQGTKMVCRCFYDYAKYGDPYRTYSKKEINKVSKKLDKYYNKLPKWLR